MPSATRSACSDDAVQAVVDLDEPEDMNPLSARVWRESLYSCKTAAWTKLRRANSRLAGVRLRRGAYGARVQNAIDERLWQTREDLAEVYLNWGGYAYGKHSEGTGAGAVRRAPGDAGGAAPTRTTGEHDIPRLQRLLPVPGRHAGGGGNLRGAKVASYHGDNSQPDNPRIRT